MVAFHCGACISCTSCISLAPPETKGATCCGVARRQGLRLLEVIEGRQGTHAGLPENGAPAVPGLVGRGDEHGRKTWKSGVPRHRQLGGCIAIVHLEIKF